MYSNYELLTKCVKFKSGSPVIVTDFIPSIFSISIEPNLILYFPFKLVILKEKLSKLMLDSSQLPTDWTTDRGSRLTIAWFIRAAPDEDVTFIRNLLLVSELYCWIFAIHFRINYLFRGWITFLFGGNSALKCRKIDFQF